MGGSSVPTRKPTQPSRGFFGIGIYQPLHEVNVGTLWRSALVFGASMVFTVGRKYKRQAADTFHTSKHIPYQHYASMEDLISHLPHSSPLVGVELDDRAIKLGRYSHPERAIYILGREDLGLPLAVRDQCHSLVQVESIRDLCLNVSVAGSLVMWHRHNQRLRSFQG